MKSNKVKMFVIMLLVLAMALSVLLVACDGPSRDDDDEDRPSKNNIFKDAKTFEDVLSTLREYIAKENFTIEGNISLSGSYFIKISDDDRIFLDIPGQYEIIFKNKDDYHKYKMNEDVWYDYESTNRELARYKEDVFDCALFLVNTGEEALAYGGTYDAKKKSFTAIRDGNAYNAEIGVNEVSFVIDDTNTGAKYEFTMRNFGTTKIGIPTDVKVPSTEPEFKGIWDGVDKTDANQVMNAIERVLISCHNYNVDVVIPGTMGPDVHIQGVHKNEYIKIIKNDVTNYFMYMHANGVDFYRSYCDKGYNDEYITKSNETLPRDTLRQRGKYFLEYFRPNNNPVEYDPSTGNFTRDVYAHVYVLELYEDGFRFTADSNDYFEMRYIGSSKVDLPADIDKYPEISLEEFEGVIY